MTLDTKFNTGHIQAVNSKNWRVAQAYTYRASIHTKFSEYTVVHKKRDTFIFSITLANIDGFS